MLVLGLKQMTKTGILLRERERGVGEERGREEGVGVRREGGERENEDTFC